MTAAELDRAVPAVAEKATFEARRLIGLGWFRPDEQDDLRQDLVLHWWRKRKAIPTGAGTGAAYGAAMLRNKARDLVRHDHTPVRDRRKSGPLPEEIPGDDRQPTLPSALISEPSFDNDIDTRRAIERLPPAKQRFAWLLAEHGVVAAAEAVGIARSTASRWKVEIREQLTAHGLGRERRRGGRRR